MKSGGRNSIFFSLPKPIPLYEFINFFTSSLLYTFYSLKRVFRIFFFLIGCKVFLSSSRLSSLEFFSLRELCKLVGLTTAKFTLKYTPKLQSDQWWVFFTLECPHTECSLHLCVYTTQHTYIRYDKELMLETSASETSRLAYECWNCLPIASDSNRKLVRRL